MIKTTSIHDAVRNLKKFVVLSNKEQEFYNEFQRRLRMNQLQRELSEKANRAPTHRR